MMLKRFYFFTLLIGVCTLITSCDSLPGTPELPSKTITLKDFRINPDTVSFRNASGVKDTIVTLRVSVKSDELDDLASPPVVHMYEKNDAFLVTSDTLELVDSLTFEYATDLQFGMSTGISTKAEFLVTAFAKTGNATNFIRKDLVIQGFSIQAPILDEVTVPDTVRIPATGTQSFSLIAKVRHPDNQNFIKNVIVGIVDQNSESLGTFNLYDDGNTQQVEGGGTSGDATARDSLFTRRFTINPSNQPDVLRLTFYAVDVSNQESNRIQVTLVFAR